MEFSIKFDTVTCKSIIHIDGATGHDFTCISFSSDLCGISSGSSLFAKVPV